MSTAKAEAVSHRLGGVFASAMQMDAAMERPA